MLIVAIVIHIVCCFYVIVVMVNVTIIKFAIIMPLLKIFSSSSLLMFISDLYDLATPYISMESTPYEVPVQTLCNLIASKSHPGNLNEDDVYTALEDIESNKKALY